MITQISEEIVRIISERLGERNDKGFETYKETLDDVPFENYDWNMMAMEELLDFAQYLMKQNIQLQYEIRRHTDKVDTKVFEKDVERTFPKKGTGNEAITNCGLGISGEAGEVADLIKKYVFQGHNLEGDKIKDELGDVLYYLTKIALMMSSSLDEIMTLNMMKRAKRYPLGFDVAMSVNREE